jgi:hypothetical protein
VEKQRNLSCSSVRNIQSKFLAVLDGCIVYLKLHLATNRLKSVFLMPLQIDLYLLHSVTTEIALFSATRTR